MNLKIIYWKETDFYLGCLEEYPDYQTQGETLDELKKNIKDIYNDIQAKLIPNIKKASIMEIVV
ncbi:MAG: hypothetical protein H7836_15245 [Magnetococcus sp. YQC-3]